VFRHLVEQVNPQSAKQLDSSLEQVSNLVGSWADREQIVNAAKNAAGEADQIVQQLRKQQYDAGLTARVMAAICGDSSTIAQQGERSAEQAAMALDTLSVAYRTNQKSSSPELKGAIDRLFQQLDNPSAYNAPMFAAQMQKVKAVLPH
jgi:hypothetical protein